MTKRQSADVKKTLLHESIVLLLALATTASAQNPVTNITLTLTNNAVLTWLWATQHLVQATAGANGTVSGNTNDWADAGQQVTNTAIPSSDYVFERWTGDVAGAETNMNPLIFTMNQPRSVQALFVTGKTVGGVPYVWLTAAGITNRDTGVDEADPDLDGWRTLDEYVADTHPANSNSQPARIELYLAGNQLLLDVPWSSTGRQYTLEGSTNLPNDGWGLITNGMGTGTNFVYPRPAGTAEEFRYWIRVP